MNGCNVQNRGNNAEIQNGVANNFGLRGITQLICMLIIRDGGKWWSKDHHLVVVKIVKNVAFSLKNVKKW